VNVIDRGIPLFHFWDASVRQQKGGDCPAFSEFDVAKRAA
jgi:hypothetical protein